MIICEQWKWNQWKIQQRLYDIFLAFNTQQYIAMWKSLGQLNVNNGEFCKIHHSTNRSSYNLENQLSVWIGCQFLWTSCPKNALFEWKSKIHRKGVWDTLYTFLCIWFRLTRSNYSSYAHAFPSLQTHAYKPYNICGFVHRFRLSRTRLLRCVLMALSSTRLAKRPIQLLLPSVFVCMLPVHVMRNTSGTLYVPAIQYASANGARRDDAIPMCTQNNRQSGHTSAAVRSVRWHLRTKLLQSASIRIGLIRSVVIWQQLSARK